MEEKRLNLNAPLLSLRRHGSSSSSSSSSSASSCSSVFGASARRQSSGGVTTQKDAMWLSMSPKELKSETVTKIAMIPFDWEHRPGKAKSDFRPVSSEVLPEMSMASLRSLPPGRMVAVEELKNVESEDPKSAFAPKKQNIKKSRLLWPNLPVKFHGGCLPKKKKKERTSLEDGNDDVLSDGSETFSLSELSAFDGRVTNASALLYGQHSKRIEHSVHLRDRSFTMDQFFPAAKTMATKQQISDERDTEVLLRPPNKHYNSLEHALRHKEDDEDQDVDDDLSGNSNPRACGFLPHRMKSRISLINPLRNAVWLKNNGQNNGGFRRVSGKLDDCRSTELDSHVRERETNTSQSKRKTICTWNRSMSTPR